MNKYGSKNLHTEKSTLTKSQKQKIRKIYQLTLHLGSIKIAPTFLRAFGLFQMVGLGFCHDTIFQLTRQYHAEMLATKKKKTP